MTDYKYIAIEGNIGVGKSTLANFLGQFLDAKLLLEEFEENESLKDFYSNKAFALQAELQFLLDRNRQLHKFHTNNTQLIIADYIPLKSLVFAQQNLSTKDFNLYRQVANQLLCDFPQPDLVIFLNRSTSDLLKNINQRGRSYEHNMDASYLDNLNETYKKTLPELVSCPILNIDAKEINLQKPQSLKNAFSKILKMQFASETRSIDLKSLVDYEFAGSTS